MAKPNDVTTPPPADREPGTRPDGEAAPPQTIDPAPDGRPDPPDPRPRRREPANNTDATGF